MRRAQRLHTSCHFRRLIVGPIPELLLRAEGPVAHEYVAVVSSQEEFEAGYSSHSTAEETVIWDIADKQVRNNRYDQAAQWCESSPALRGDTCE